MILFIFGSKSLLVNSLLKLAYALSGEFNLFHHALL